MCRTSLRKVIANDGFSAARSNSTSMQAKQRSPCAWVTMRSPVRSSHHASSTRTVMALGVASPPWARSPKLISSYSREMSSGSPMFTMRPRSISIARSQKRRTDAMSWVTKRIVRPSAFIWSNWSKHFCWNDASPTASTSSTSSTSASACTATANPRRTLIPDE